MEDGQNAGRHGGHPLFSLPFFIAFFIAQVPGIIIRRTVVFLVSLQIVVRNTL